MQKQRVNIQYSVSLDQLPDETHRIINVADNYFRALSAELLESMPSNVMSLEAYEHIDSIRQDLAQLDANLSDVNNIIQSYLSYKTQQISPQPAPNQAPTLAAAPQMPNFDMSNLPLPDNLADLQSKIAEFKKSVAATEGRGEVAD